MANQMRVILSSAIRWECSFSTFVFFCLIKLWLKYLDLSQPQQVTEKRVPSANS